MKIDITCDKKNPLLERRDIEFFLHHDGITPSKKDLEKKLADKLNAKEAHVVVTHIFQGAGRWDATGLAKVYDKAVKDAPAEEKEAAPAEKEEPKTEEKKEEHAKEKPAVHKKEKEPKAAKTGKEDKDISKDVENAKKLLEDADKDL